MNKSKLKSYAPQARKDFIAMVQSRAAQLGIAEVKGQLHTQPAEVQGDVAVIAGQAFPAKVARQRDRLIARMQKDGFAATVEAIAYTWFNRLAALRYMELHNFLGHGQRVLSSVTEGGLPDILTHALEIAESGELPGISVAEVSELKLASKDGELYKRLLVAQCNQLAGHMGFLFERIDDDSELLLPDNLLRSDSVVRKLVDSIDEDDWQQVEIIGWLYQFYISEKKDQVIGKVVKSADIPAATQLFTPNWIVKYLVQNSVGRLWLQANPASTLAGDWAYYIQPAEQTPEVNDELTALIRARIAEDGDTLNPESITVLDPACGSGHILVEAYDLLKAIYLERGYRERDIPRLILEKNLFGLDIDDRAAQLAAFALLMKARADDRRLFTEPVQLNVLSLQESAALDAAQLAQELGITDAAERQALLSLIATFAQAKTFGSLLQIPAPLANALPTLAERIAAAQANGDLYAQSAATALQPLLQQAQVLARQYDAVVANPPYMGSKYLNPALKDYLKKHYKGYEKDLFSAFMIRDLAFAKPAGQLGFMSPFVWMFISSYEELRQHFIDETTLTSLVQLEYSGFDGATVPICTFTLAKSHLAGFAGSYIRLSDFRGADQQGPKTLEAIQNPDCGWFYVAKPDDFKKIPGSPVAYWLVSNAISAFETANQLGEISTLKHGMSTSDNARFLRYWYEVSTNNFEKNCASAEDAMSSGKKWFPFCKGGSYRRWYGNFDYVVNWLDNGKEIKEETNRKYPYLNGNLGFVIGAEEFYFKDAITWSSISSASASFRYLPHGSVICNKGQTLYVSEKKDTPSVLAVLNSKVSTYFLEALSPTIGYELGYVKCIPIIIPGGLNKSEIRNLVDIHKSDWDEQEISWDFTNIKFISGRDLNSSWATAAQVKTTSIQHAAEHERHINELVINEYKLNDILTADVDDDQITLIRPDREKDMQRLVSYAIGCMMGRYSLDQPGLVYAHAGNVGFDPTRYTRFPADADGIVPVGDMAWFPDDATARVKEFLLAVWGPDTFAENLAWLADSLGRKADETAEDALRRYISGSFFKDHCQTYKKRPIYWLFSSGKHKAFEALVYLHRYNEATLARMRAEYVVPLTGRMAERIALLEDDASKASTGAARKALDKQVDKLKKKLEELRLFDEKLRHYADQRIELDLDDGVKVNYGKFGDLLDNVKAISGGSGDD
ncbi:BREX-1 system adenine-specific DNA-methyltransferase PglX [Laribacter hongkongensis]|uniref:BREX-1 system adenine-specific DNA-methyltransferase PglX n=1 Tax=Laribacter hongkongensis TaxID=168471 RepID=UPI001EFD24E7|nr:BREX-1 system adenine-specific DNA-methyltransferase PglX [Laribacter hongkongensis]MCG9000250.1 BREX-1 system adenine-specific DNA-methyltransferase PglX [Laribacter hongkongensis]MCG9006640.1 BREX-1 system adenine-specific DNA-methyltransferase PglX [Laribacter hongkongensis]MCG9015690.1 BREX-1 system adenine-specific DNA-methyltransferase PglX [Laribacter hongkongensis]